MFFNGDPSTRKRVDLGGRSSKERDRQKLLEQTRLERNRRLWVKQQNAAALKIQVSFCSYYYYLCFSIDCNLRVLICILFSSLNSMPCLFTRMLYALHVTVLF
jgi:hypothetical protein